MTVLRSTQQALLVAQSSESKLRMTHAFVQVLYTEVPDAARATQQVVEVLYKTTAVPEARVTQQFIEVLYATSSAIEESPSNTLTFSQDATTENILTRALTSTLTFVGVAAGTGVERVGNTLQFEQVVTNTGSVLNPAALSQIVFTQDAVCAYMRAQDTSSTLTFVQTVHCAKILDTQEASSTLTFSQSVSDFRLTTSELEFTQDVSWAWGGQEIYPTNTLTFSQSVTVDLIINTSASNTLVFTQSTLQGYVAEGATDITQTLTFSHYAVGTIVATDRYVMLQAPYPQVAASVILPAAEHDDKENALGDMKIKRAMDGTRRTYVYRSDDRRLAYTFDMTREKGLELQAFLETYNAEHLRLQNWKGEIWDVQLLTNPLEFTQNRRSDPDGANCAINLEFEGVKLSG